MGMDIISPIDYSETSILKNDFSNFVSMNRLQAWAEFFRTKATSPSVKVH